MLSFNEFLLNEEDEVNDWYRQHEFGGKLSPHLGNFFMILTSDQLDKPSKTGKTNVTEAFDVGSEVEDYGPFNDMEDKKKAKKFYTKWRKSVGDMVDKVVAWKADLDQSRKQKSKELQSAVSSGKMSQEQADAELAKHPAKLTNYVRAGFHAAFPENEDEKTRKQKATDARNHFRRFMHEHAGLSENNGTELTSSNGKTKKSTGVGRKTKGIAMAPHAMAGIPSWNSCPKSSAECRAGCLGLTVSLNKAGSSLRAKVARTHYMVMHPEQFARLMDNEITSHEKTSKRLGLESGFRGNVTTDHPYEDLLPRSFFDKHRDTTFYDYTKRADRIGEGIHGNSGIPNYHLALSHTGTGHKESNDKDAIKVLNSGGVVTMVYKKKSRNPTHVEDVATGKRWKVVDGDSDDNVDDRHAMNDIPKNEGVVSGLLLKGVKNEDAGYFANDVDNDGIIRINKPTAAKKVIPIVAKK